VSCSKHHFWLRRQPRYAFAPWRLDLTEASVCDAGKPRLTHAEVKKRCDLK
jgi:hypothetical protein